MRIPRLGLAGRVPHWVYRLVLVRLAFGTGQCEGASIQNRFPGFKVAIGGTGVRKIARRTCATSFALPQGSVARDCNEMETVSWRRPSNDRNRCKAVGGTSRPSGGIG